MAEPAFDLASAKPVGSGFDLASAKPVRHDNITAPVNPATDFGGSTLQVGPFNTHIPISQGVNNFLAGAGKATEDLVRGAGQLIPWYRPQTLSGLITGDKGGWGTLETRKDVAQARKLDAPLMNTGAGKAGFLTGTTADLLPTAFIPGAGTLAGSAAIGAGTGLLQPSTGTGETLKNTFLGGALGPAGVLGGRAVGALAKGGHAALEPFLPGGAQRIAARSLQAFAGGPQAAVQAAHELANSPSVLPGVQPTMGELTSNAGVAQLQRSLASNPETMAQLTARDQSNIAAMKGALSNMTSTDSQRAVDEGLRRDFTRPFYEQAGKVNVPVDDALNRILTRPSMDEAWRRAEQLAAENDEKLVRPQLEVAMGRVTAARDADGNLAAPIISGKAIQYLKMALSDLANTGPQRGMGAHETNALKNTLSDLNGWIGKNVPALRMANGTYAWASRPLNQSEIAGRLADKLSPALADFGQVPRVKAENFANALSRQGDSLAADVTGNKNATLEGTMSPRQLSTLNLIGQQLARRANAADLGRAAGSNTAQNLAGQNLLRQFLGPFGLPQSTLGRAASSVLGRSLARPYGFVARAAEPDIQQFIAHAALDPKLAAQMLSRPTAKALSQVWKRQGYLTPLSNVGLIANSAQ